MAVALSGRAAVEHEKPERLRRPDLTGGALQAGDYTALAGVERRGEGRAGDLDALHLLGEFGRQRARVVHCEPQPEQMPLAFGLGPVLGRAARAGNQPSPPFSRVFSRAI